MPDDLETLVREALPCSCDLHGTPEARALCVYHQYAPAVRDALREAENRGARRIRELLAAQVYADTGDRAIRAGILNTPLPHPEQQEPTR